MNLFVCLPFVLIFLGAMLIFDEIGMLVVGAPQPGWLLGDLSFLHVEPLHHWMLGVVMILVGVLLGRRS